MRDTQMTEADFWESEEALRRQQILASNPLFLVMKIEELEQRIMELEHADKRTDCGTD